VPAVRSGQRRPVGHPVVATRRRGGRAPVDFATCRHGVAAVTAGIFCLVVVLRRGRAWRRFRLPGADRSRESARIDVPARVSRNRSSCGRAFFVHSMCYVQNRYN
jgi:hypothetical protein